MLCPPVGLSAPSAYRRRRRRRSRRRHVAWRRSCGHRHPGVAVRDHVPPEPHQEPRRVRHPPPAARRPPRPRLCLGSSRPRASPLRPRRLVRPAALIPGMATQTTDGSRPMTARSTCTRCRAATRARSGLIPTSWLGSQTTAQTRATPSWPRSRPTRRRFPQSCSCRRWRCASPLLLPPGVPQRRRGVVTRPTPVPDAAGRLRRACLSGRRADRGDAREPQPPGRAQLDARRVHVCRQRCLSGTLSPPPAARGSTALVWCGNPARPGARRAAAQEARAG